MTISIRSARDPEKSLTIPQGALSVIRGTSCVSASKFLFGTLVAESERRIALLLESDLLFDNPSYQQIPEDQEFKIRGLPLTISLRRAAREDHQLCLDELLGINRALINLLEEKTVGSEFRNVLAEFCERYNSQYLGIGFPLAHQDFLESQKQFLQLGLYHLIVGDRVFHLEHPEFAACVIAESDRLAMLIDRFEVDQSAQQRILSTFRDLSAMRQQKALLFHLKPCGNNWTAEPIDLFSRSREVLNHSFEFYSLPTLEQTASRLSLEAHYKSLLEVEISNLMSSWREYSHPSRNLDLLFETLSCLENLGLGHLTLNRTVQSLSTGEYRRILLARNQLLPRQGSLLAIEEPSFGLHPLDQRKLRRNLEELGLQGHTIIVSDEQESFVNSTSNIIDLHKLLTDEPGQNTREINNTQSAFLAGSYSHQNSETWLSFSHLSRLHLKDISIKLPCSQLCCLSGISGSGKSTLLFSELVPRLQDSPENFKSIIELRSESLPAPRQQMLGSYLGMHKFLARFMAGLETSRIHGFTEKSFAISNSSESLACKACKALGYFPLRSGIRTCEKCQGQGFKAELLKVKYRGLNFRQLLSRSLNESFDFLNLFARLEYSNLLLRQLQLSHLRLDSLIERLSLGELQRLSLVKELSTKRQTPLFIALDEPCAGLNKTERHILNIFLRNLAHSGHTICVIEHSSDFLMNADYIIDLGPGAGSRGGQIIFSGTPQEMIKVGKGYTADELRSHIASTDRNAHA